MENEKFVEHAAHAARRAGKIIMEYYEQPASAFMLGEKGNPNSIVTKADKDAEAAIVEYLSGKTPQASFLGEESGETGTGKMKWVVDPVDGTTNFANKIPLFCVSIGLANETDLLAGVVYNPVADEMYSAAKGAGAFLNKKKIAVAKHCAKHERVVATDWAHDSAERLRVVDDFLAAHVNDYRYVHCIGSAALALAWVAAGRFHAYVHPYLNPWDVAAGALLVREAGGKLFRWDGSQWQYPQGEIAATNGQFPL